MSEVRSFLDLETRKQVSACGYNPIEIKGHGSYGLVYEVGTENGKKLAFKYIIPNKDLYKIIGLECLIEVDILSRLHHPNIMHSVKVITPQDCGIEGMAIILPLGERTLNDIAGTPFATTDNKLPIFYKLASALEFLHSLGILHLDIKSSNVVIKDNIPYFIDFGISLFVDDSVVGQYDQNIRVSYDHRAPEILDGSHIYNAAVDIWAFGIMLLFTLTTNTIYKVKYDKISHFELSDIITNMFSDPDSIPLLLDGISSKYLSGCIDLLTKILQIDPTKRITAKQIREHYVFDDFRTEISGFTENPIINTNYAIDHRNILKYIIYAAFDLFPKRQVKILFLAIDLFNRTASKYAEKTEYDRIGLGFTCLWVAYKLIKDISYPLDKFIKDVKCMAKFDDETILDCEIEIISSLSGILNVSALYSACKTVDDLDYIYTNIILNHDTSLYANTDIPTLIETMKNKIPAPIYKGKNISIEEFFK